MFVLFQTIAAIFEKFKEKKQNVVTSLREAADAVYLSVSNIRSRGFSYPTKPGCYLIWFLHLFRGRQCTVSSYYQDTTLSVIDILN